MSSSRKSTSRPSRCKTARTRRSGPVGVAGEERLDPRREVGLREKCARMHGVRGQSIQFSSLKLPESHTPASQRRSSQNEFPSFSLPIAVAVANDAVARTSGSPRPILAHGIHPRSAPDRGKSLRDAKRWDFGPNCIAGDRRDMMDMPGGSRPLTATRKRLNTSKDSSARIHPTALTSRPVDGLEDRRGFRGEAPFGPGRSASPPETSGGTLVVMSSFTTRPESDVLVVQFETPAGLNDFRNNSLRDALYELVQTRQRSRTRRRSRRRSIISRARASRSSSASSGESKPGL